MSRSIYFSAVNTPSYTHELIYRYDSPFSNRYSSKLEDKIAGKSAYDLAVENGFNGTVEDWLNSLKGQDGQTPYIGENGHWFIGDIDTNIIADGDFVTHSDIADFNNKLNSVYHYKGSLANREALNNIENPEVGDTYNLEDTGMNVAWTGTNWDDFGPEIANVNSMSQEEIDSLFASSSNG